jgi:Family of unknown function (DUF6526)
MLEIVMKEQNFTNHVRYHPVYHFVMIPLGLLIVGTAAYLAFKKDDLVEGLFYLLSSVLLFLTILIARINALAVQNRLIRTEFALRYQELSGKSFREWQDKIRLSQIIALRFASDEELLALIEKTAAENLSPKDIKKRVQNWQGDYYRV